jgi:hypothetical protein
MRLLSRIALGLCAFALPVMAAASDTTVRDLKAELQNGQVHVTWTAPEKTDGIAYYHVYYGHASILGNNGAYDDFDTTSGKKTDYILTSFPKSTRLFVAVLPVNDAGVDIGRFEKETSVLLQDAGTDTSSAPATPAGDSLLKLQRAQSVSATGVLLTFNLTPRIRDGQAQEAFRVEYGQSQTLPLIRLALTGNQILLTTAAQTPGTAYTVRLSSALYAIQTDGSEAPLDPAAGMMPVDSGSAPAAQPSTVSAPSAPQVQTAVDVRNLQIRMEPDDSGFYTVIAAWDPTADGATGFRIRQSTDRGITFSPAQSAAADARAARFQGVAPGSFGVLVQALGPDGTPSTGQFLTIDLPRTGPAPSDGLAHSGPEMLAAVLALSGGAAGWKYVRSRQA